MHLTYGEMAEKSIMPGYWRVEESPGARFFAYTNTRERARLIAAAPALYAALRDIVECCATDHDEELDRTCEPSNCTVCATREVLQTVQADR